MQLRISSADGKSVSVLKLSPLSEEVEGTYDGACVAQTAAGRQGVPSRHGCLHIVCSCAGATLRVKADQVVVKLQKKVALPWDALLKGPEASTFDYDA